MSGDVRIRWAKDAREQILNHEGVTQAVEDLAGQIAAEVAVHAPQGEGSYLNGIRVVEKTGPDGVTYRAVRATDAKSAYIEFGTGPRETSKGADRGEMPAYHPLTRAAETVGARVQPAEQS